MTTNVNALRGKFTRLAKKIILKGKCIMVKAGELT